MQIILDMITGAIMFALMIASVPSIMVGGFWLRGVGLGNDRVFVIIFGGLGLLVTIAFFVITTAYITTNK